MKGLSRAAIALSAVSVVISYSILILNCISLRKAKKLSKITEE
ncbi:MAG: hypothetical protein RR495_00010 [Anaerovoracaceae bacterium]